LRADDTEIFVSEPKDTAAARPNILLIIDTSGSMVSNNVTQPMDYDPITKYTGGSCTADKIYWKTGNGSVSCSSGSKHQESVHRRGRHGPAKRRRTSSTRFGTYVSALHGAVARRLQRSLGSAARRPAHHDQPGRVSGDAAIKHGLADNDGKLPRNGSQGPFTTDATQAVSLAGQNTYTFYSGNYLNYLSNLGNDNQVTLTRLEVVKSVGSPLPRFAQRRQRPV
jgi:hypothetical protein